MLKQLSKRNYTFTFFLFHSSSVVCGWRTLDGDHCYGCCRCRKNSRQQRRCRCHLRSACRRQSLRQIIADSHSVSFVSIWLDWGTLIGWYRLGITCARVNWLRQAATCRLFSYCRCTISGCTVASTCALPKDRNWRLTCLLHAIRQAALSTAGSRSIGQTGFSHW